MVETRQTVAERSAEFENSYSAIASEIDGPELSELFAEGDTRGIKKGIERFNSAARASIPEGSPFIQVFLRSSFSVDGEGNLAPVKVTISTRPSNPVSFKSSVHLDSTDSWDKVYEFVGLSYISLLRESALYHNLNELNENLDDLLADSDVSVAFTSGGRVVSGISDDALILSVNEDRIYDVGDVIAFATPDSGIDEEVIESARAQFVSEVDGETTVSILENPPSLVKYFMVPNRRGAIKLIKEAFPKTWKQVKDSERGGVFVQEADGALAVLEKDEDGVTVLLSPVNEETLERVDVDILQTL